MRTGRWVPRASARGGISWTTSGAIWYELAHGRRAQARVVDRVLNCMSGSGFCLDSLGVDCCLVWDRGWRIWGWGVSGKRTVPQGESRRIKPNQSKNASLMGLIMSLGHQVGERGERGRKGAIGRSGTPEFPNELVGHANSERDEAWRFAGAGICLRSHVAAVHRFDENISLRRIVSRS